MSKDQFNPAASEGVREGFSMNDSSREKEVERYSPTALMFKNRVIIVAGQVDTNLALNVIAQVKHLEFANPEEPITLLINSPGGSVIDGMAMFDVIRQCSCPIITIGNGMQASMGSIMLAAGDQRFMTPNADLMIHQIMTGANGGTQHTDFEIRSGHTARLHEALKSVYVEFTGLKHEYWDLVMERDTWLTAEQAMKIGYINGVTTSKKPGGKYADEAKREMPVDSMTAAILEKIEKMSKDDVVKALNNGQANGAEWGKFRPNLVVRLAEFPEFWTDKRRAEAGLAASNDDKKPAARSAGRKTAGPSA